MTYCLAIRLKEGLVFLGDTRTNAGVDNVSTYRKVHLFQPDPDRLFVLESAGNLATTQEVLDRIEHDLGDGTVVIKFAPGHTPGHQSLFLRLANTGNVLLSGDLYHYPEEITLKKVPLRDPDREQTAKSREKIEDFVKQNHAQLWIQHDYVSGIKRKIAPAFYD